MNVTTKEFKEIRNNIHGKVMGPCENQNYTYVSMLIQINHADASCL